MAAATVEETREELLLMQMEALQWRLLTAQVQDAAEARAQEAAAQLAAAAAAVLKLQDEAQDADLADAAAEHQGMVRTALRDTFDGLRAAADGQGSLVAAAKELSTALRAVLLRVPFLDGARLQGLAREGAAALQPAMEQLHLALRHAERTCSSVFAGAEQLLPAGDATTGAAKENLAGTSNAAAPEGAPADDARQHGNGAPAGGLHATARAAARLQSLVSEEVEVLKQVAAARARLDRALRERDSLAVHLCQARQAQLQRLDSVPSAAAAAAEAAAHSAGNGAALAGLQLGS